MPAEALHKGCMQDDLLLVTTILDQQGVNVDAKDKQGRTALHLAAIDNNHLMAQLLLQYGANTVAVSDSKQIPLDCASDGEMILLLARAMAKDGNETLLREKIKKMNKPKKIKQKENKLRHKFPPEKRILPSLTGYLGQLKVTDVLDIKECDSTKTSLSNVSELSICDSGYIGMDVGMSNNDLVSTVCSTTDSCDRGNNASPKQRRKTSPLTQQELNAIDSNRNRDLSETKNPAKKTKVRRKTHPTRNASILKQNISKSKEKKQVRFPSEVLLDIAIVNDEFVEACHLIKSTKLDINRPGSNGLTPLHRAVIEGSYDCLQLLVDQGAEVNIRDEHGWTPLHDAVYHENVSCVAALLKAGANVTLLTDDMYSVLELANSENMLLVIGRALILYELGFVAEIGDYIALNVTNRESCV